MKEVLYEVRCLKSTEDMTWYDMVKLGKKSVWSLHKPNLRNCFLPQTKFDCSKGCSARTILYLHYPRILAHFFLFGLIFAMSSILSNPSNSFSLYYSIS